MSKYSKRQLDYMLKHKRDSTLSYDNNFLTDRDYEEIYKDIDNVKNKSKKRAIADEGTGIDRGIENGGIYYGKRLKTNVKTTKEKAYEPERKIITDDRSLVDGITVAGQKDKRGSDVTSDDDVVDENNNFYHSSQSHSLETARYTDGMSSQGTRTSNNKYNILMEKIETLMNMVAELTEEIKKIKQKRRVVREKNDETMYSKWNITINGKSVLLYSVSFSDKEEELRTYRHHMIVDSKIKPEAVDLMENVVTKFVLRLLDKPQIFEKYLMDNLFTKEQLMKYKFSVGFNRTSKRIPLPRKIKNEVMALLKYARVSLIEED